jgi:hypothetical protein
MNVANPPVGADDDSNRQIDASRLDRNRFDPAQQGLLRHIVLEALVRFASVASSRATSLNHVAKIENF